MDFSAVSIWLKRLSSELKNLYASGAIHFSTRTPFAPAAMDATLKQEVQTLIKDTLADFQQHLEKTRDKTKDKELEDRIKDVEEVKRE